MKHLKTYCIFGWTILLMLVLTGSAWSSTKVGSNAAQFLKIGVGARATALSGSFVALADDASALYWNPAGAAWLEGRHLLVTHTESFAELDHAFAAFTLPVSGSSTIGVHFVTLYSPEMEQTTIEQPGGTGVFFEARDIALGLTYARQMTDRFTFGLTGKYIQQSIFNESAEGLAFDIGGILQTDFQGLRIGVSMSNFGDKLTLEGRDLIVSYDSNQGAGNPLTPAKLETQGWSLPIVFRLGLALDALGARENLLGPDKQRLTFLMDGYHTNDADETMSLGMEYAYKETLFLRGGYRLNHDTETFSIGFGSRLKVQQWQLQLDYSYSDLSDLDSMQRFGLGVVF